MTNSVGNPVAVSPTKEELFLGRLRSETAPLHRKLEQSPLSVIVMNPAITAHQYALYLTAMRSVMAWCEAIIYPVIAAVITDLDCRKKLDAIDHDLSSLKNFATESIHLPAFSFSEPTSVAKAIGFMYVLEGSSLGGMVIVKQLQRQPFLNQDTSRFLTVYGKNTGSYWKTFLNELCLYATNNMAEDEIIDGAVEGFRSIETYFHSIRVNS